MTPEQQVRHATAQLVTQGITVRYVKGWNSPKIAGKGSFSPRFVMMHHTAGTSSLAYMTRAKGEWGPVRLAHFLVNRDGSLDVCASVKTYHAGKGGPRWGVGAGLMNGYAWGIEIEDLGRAQTMTDAQIDTAAALAAGLLDAMGVGDDKLIQHREWNPSGKTDTRYPTEFWRDRVGEARKRAADDEVPKGIVKASTISPSYATPAASPVTVTGGLPFTAAVLDLPKGRYVATFQVLMPEGAGAGEAKLVYLDYPSEGKESEAIRNPVPAATQLGGDWYRWRTPFEHPVSAPTGGQRIAFRITMPEGTHELRFACKAIRVA